jgi:4a-hydroxytetrahydrobiopterin dehydratase
MQINTTLLTLTDLKTMLGEGLHGWAYHPATEKTPSSLTKHWRFADFQQAFAFMQQVATIAESQNHHPDWRNAYNQLWITLSTHDARGVTQQDVDFILAVEMLQK